MNLYQLAFSNISRRKLRSALTMLGIIIGAATIMALVGTTTGLTSAVKDQTNAYMYDVMISPASSSGYSLMDSQTVSKVRSMPKLFDFREVTLFSDTVNGNKMFFEGTNDWKQLKLKSGTPGVVINQVAADKLGYGIGSKIKIKNKELTVTGINNEGQAPYAYINQDTAKQMAGDKVSAIYARTNGDPKTVGDEVKKQINDISVQTKSEKIAQVQDMTSQALLFIGIIASIALLVGVISVINTMLISVMERTKELGVLKAIGFTNWELKGSILFESGLLGFSGAVIGIILGIAAIIVIANMLRLTEYIPGMLPLWLIASVVAGATLLSILAGLYPAMRASKLNVVEALRHE